MITPGYQQSDLERFVSEDRVGPIRRGEFSRDRARVLHSSALRRLGAKTQVLSPTTGDFARTRLTHSLEVAQVGREMATELGIDPDVVDTACLAHDLGHPPFGHNGEKALNTWAKEIGGFEGNAQTLRLLSRIEPKVIVGGKSRGLNLTRASLDAACKYPWSRSEGTPQAGGDQSVKFGYYSDDLEIFQFLRKGSISDRKCIEAEVMDFADDVAYSVHDFEDAIVAGFISPRELIEGFQDPQLLQKIRQWSGFEITDDEITLAFDRLASNEYWLDDYDGTLGNQATLKNLTSALIGSLVRRTTDATSGANSSRYIVRYEGTLIVPSTVAAEIAVLKGVVSAFLMNQEKRQPYYEWQRAILTELADALLAKNGQQLDAYCTLAWRLARDDEERHRVIVDQVASLTDVSAINLHHQLVTN
ncbi:MAG: deoxyguanosinetriphosphate triphosphohydrolase [Actinomycetota bacterium]